MVGGTMVSGGEKEEWMQRDVFHTWCTSQCKVCKMIIDSGCFENLMSIKMVQKLCLETVPHPNPYQVCGLRKGVVIEASIWCLVSFPLVKLINMKYGVMYFLWKNVIYSLEDHGFTIDDLFMMISSILILLR